MTIPAYNEMYYECLKLFSDKLSHCLKDVIKHMVVAFDISQAEQKQMLLKANQTVLYNRCCWCTSYLAKAGLLEKSARGTYQITKTGIEQLNIANVTRNNNRLIWFVNKHYNKNDYEYNNVCVKQENTTLDEIDLDINNNTPDERLADIYQRISAKLADELLSKILEQTSVFFEQLVIKLLERMGYGGYDNTVTQPSKDGGIDGFINEDKLGFGKIYIQAKKWDIAQTIGRPEIQKFVGALHGYNAPKGLFITTAKFSKEAVEYAKTCNIILVDGEKLASLMIEYDFGVSTECVYKIKRIDSDFFADDDE